MVGTSPVSDLVQIASGFALAEAPAVLDDESVYFCDVRLGGVYRAMPGAEPEEVILHRRGIGGMVAHADGGFVVSGKNLAHKALDQTTTVLAPQAPPRMVCNDLTTSRDGRVYVGSFAVNDPFGKDEEGRTGALLQIALDCSITMLDDDFIAPNGMAFSVNGDHLYVNETGRHALWRYDVDHDGDLSGKAQLFDYDSEMCDGMAMAEDGTIWVAVASADYVLVLDERGTLVTKVGVPVESVKSVCFGGADRKTVYFCGGSHREEDRSGGVYMGRSEVAGRPVPLCRIDLSKGRVERSTGRSG